ncbi:hypothetical protein BK751_20090 [Bacillus thuringiensis serovar galleriae]|nr:hypothetical protein BF15_06945 [Bacillus thuringiensis]OTW58211.1 hypothetical protein BK701_18300 [Bacillus thuringiensis serovar amagiensis]OTY66642.1 hypothetical protein BK747_13090 [Bacillus thuringiensis serovar azorensis]OTY86126.1 hypothetical protein BK751_20090 [Bacillus thuringiensis serovar galleriae]OTZ54872.1 hypothetical protein BK766_18550 [Bacillus thuringiensis serovar wuhanensis]
MRFGDDNEELDAFKQCIFIGRKRAAKKNDTYFNDTLPYIDQAKINGNFVFFKVSGPFLLFWGHFKMLALWA